jgi:small subunit ribosomal protein S2
MQNDAKDTNNEGLVRELFKVGAHFGYGRRSRHPSVLNFLFGFKNRTVVIDLEKTALSLEKAKAYLYTLGTEGKKFIIVGNKNEARSAVSKMGKELDMPYVAERWIGGTFTNFKQIRSRVERMVDLKGQRDRGELLAKYNKKERGRIGKEIEDLERYFLSIETMDKLPAAMLVIDAKEEHSAVAEAKQLKIPVVAICNSDVDVRGLDYPIVANDASMGSIGYLVDQLASAYEDGKKHPKPVEKPVVAPAVPEAK